MGLFDFFKPKKKNYTITTTLNGNTAKGRQDLLAELVENHIDLKASLSISNASTITIAVYAKKQIGTVDSRITREIEKKYGNNNGFSCDITIGQNYTIKKDEKGNFVCVATLTVIPE